MVQSAIAVDEKDNVATSLRCPEAGSSIRIGMASYSIDVSLSQIIPLGHKFALRDIDEGEPVVKYGEVIGLAIQINVVRPTKAS